MERKIQDKVEEKVNVNEVQNALDSCQAEISNTFNSFKNEANSGMKDFENDIIKV